MNTNKILVAGLIGGVAAFLLGWLVFGILLKDAMVSPVAGFMKPEEDMIWWAMIASNLIWGMTYAYIFVQWASISTWMTGAKAGAILGLLISLSYDLSFFAMTNMFTMQSMLMDVLASVFMSAAIGAVIGWWLGRK